jgi:hypothetical protein
MTRRTSNRLAALAAAVLAGALAGCAAPAPEVIPEPPPAPAVPEPEPVDPYHSRPAATISLPVGPTTPGPGGEGPASAASKPAAQPLASASGSVAPKADAVRPSASGSAPAPKADAAQPPASGSGAVQPAPAPKAAAPQPPASASGALQPAPTAAANPQPPPKAGTVQSPASGSGSTVAGGAPTQAPSLAEAVVSAANALFAGADSVQGGAARSAAGRLALTIDPPVDGTTGFQTGASRSVQARIVKLVREQYPRYELKPFTTAALAARPLLLLGTVTPVDKDGGTRGTRDAFRLCLALVDLQSGRVVSKGSARANPAGVDASPTLFFADSPAWAPDAATQGYLKTCQEANPGDPINPTYSGRLPAAALVNDGVIAYEAGDHEQAYQVFSSLQRAPGGDQLRAHNGLYLASQKLGRRDDAIRAFAHLVNFGLAQKQLGITFQFRPGSASFVEDLQVSGEYPVWLSVVSQVAERRSDCIAVSGHAGHTDPEPLNDRLSLMRAQYIKQRIDAAGETIGNRTRAVGNRENRTGPGTDDALDARVEFRVLDCKARPS